jgi:YrbI family 3-deoxy-D-manno-octulosonate 8-phosphate phosphatase
MKNIGFIPLRKNSKGIPGKNKRKFLGRPLFCWVLTEAVFSELDEVFIFTDDEWIIEFIQREYFWTEKIKLIKRSSANASDESSTESAIMELCRMINFDFDKFMLLQATSVFTKSSDINKAIKEIGGSYDSVVSVVPSHRFYWENNNPINYDPVDRPRRQDFKGSLVENGAIYLTRKEALQSSGIRISGKIFCMEMPEVSYTEIDSEADWQVAEIMQQDLLIRQKDLKRIEILVLDVDGVFTDGKVSFGAEGELSKSFDMRDGMGLEILRQYNVEVVVITSENSSLVASRMKKLNIDHQYLGIKDKFGFFKHLANKNSWDLGNVAYIGDDINDMAIMCATGWSLTPANAMDQIKSIADVKLSRSSGDGAIREATNFILNYNKRFE